MRPGNAGDEAALRQVFLLAVLPAVVTWGAITLSYAFPMMDPAGAPYFDLTTNFSQGIYWLSQSGGKIGIFIVTLPLLTLLAARGPIAARRRWREVFLVLITALICGGGGAVFNEYYLKEQLQVPRPNVVWLAGDNGSGPLGMTVDEFYKGRNREARGKVLSTVLETEPQTIRLTPLIKAHWIDETGYSFPSGHAFSSMFVSTFLLAIAATYLPLKRLLLYYPLLPWAIAVCFSRLILRVHTPTDITVGGALGVMAGVGGWAIVRVLIRRQSKNQPVCSAKNGSSDCV